MIIPNLTESGINSSARISRVRFSLSSTIRSHDGTVDRFVETKMWKSFNVITVRLRNFDHIKLLREQLMYNSKTNYY